MPDRPFPEPAGPASGAAGPRSSTESGRSRPIPCPRSGPACRSRRSCEEAAFLTIDRRAGPERQQAVSQFRVGGESQRGDAVGRAHRDADGNGLGRRSSGRRAGLLSRHVAESPRRDVWPSVPLVGRGTQRDGAMARSCRFPAVPDKIERAGKVRARSSSNRTIGAGDLAPITLLDSGCRVLIGVRCPSGDRTRSTKPRKVAKLSARAGNPASQVSDYHRTGPRRPSRGPEAYDPRTAEKITSRDTRIVRKIQLEPPE